MPLLIVRNDITKTECDAIVTAANENLSGGGGVDGAVHLAAGPKLLKECLSLGACATGKAKITKGYDLPAKYVIHAVGPLWKGGNSGEEELLASAYRESLSLALSKNCESVAFPLISTGAYGFPREKAMKIALDCFSEFLFEHEMLIYLTVFDKESTELGEKLFPNISKYIDDNYIGIKQVEKEKKRRERALSFSNCREPSDFAEPCCLASMLTDEKPVLKKAAPKKREPSLEEALSMIDESFSEMLLRKIDEKGMTDAECYKKANVDRKLFSKIRSNLHYHPKKKTVLAFAIALELSLEETSELLLKAGFSLTKSSKFDIIIQYFIENGVYDVFKINEALFSFDQDLLGP